MPSVLAFCSSTILLSFFSLFNLFFFNQSFLNQSHFLLSLSVLLVNLTLVIRDSQVCSILLLFLRFAIMSMRCNLLYKERHVWLKTSLHWRRKYTEFFTWMKWKVKNMGIGVSNGAQPVIPYKLIARDILLVYLAETWNSSPV